ncbi:mucoidy inhibitor MuiA family protein [Nannocystis bainbridge]|uniref:Mucoidy inhibitor MuiA family protein n=1 Tax=Nannocystis bainbridge TaxID=2995303 RepID=A0ABT5DVR8_9BACT|nr:mucoidy inhibitor MuiA family protein [Nannocystis bainbridge]MDC0717174.1 mucoidy inhibitor MuiA family protein [Nannocystis bainbridge]
MTEPTLIEKHESATPSVAPVELKAPIVEVTVLEDRAHVVRRAAVELRAGLTRLRVAGVAPVLADKTLCAAIAPHGGKAGDGGRERVSDVRVRRSRLVLGDDKPERARELQRERDRLSQRLGELQAARELAQHHETALAGVGEVVVQDIGVDVCYGGEAPKQWAEALALVAAREHKVREERLALDFEIVEVEAELARLNHRIGATAQVSDAVAAEVVVEVWVATAGAYAVQVDYVVPGACWRPYHRAQLVELVKGADPVLHFSSEGCVWQNTGEDWSDVQLIFSTERPSLGTEPPQLASDLLFVQRKSEAVVVEAREQEVQTTGLGSAPKQRSQDLPGIDDGGEALSLRASARASVPSDGRPYRVPLMSGTLKTTSEHVLMAELAEAVILKTTHVNDRLHHPILAGPVDLIKNGGFVGRTSVLFIAPGENFAIGWGPDGAVRVQRSVTQAREERGMLSGWASQIHKIEVKLSNLGPQARTVQVSERVPVSEIEKVKIEVDATATSDRARPDNNGLVRWKVELPGYGRASLNLGYIVRKHGDVVGI